MKSHRRDLLWSAWLVGIVLAGTVQRLAAGRTPWLAWIEQALLPLVRGQ